METAAETRAALSKGSVAEPVIGRALIRVHENIVRFPKLLKFFLSVGVVRIFVRMKLDRELPIGALDLLFGGVSRDVQHLVIIAFLGGHLSNLTHALVRDQTTRSTWSQNKGTSERQDRASIFPVRSTQPRSTVAVSGL